jgi:uncharacterized membrane protein
MYSLRKNITALVLLLILSAPLLVSVFQLAQQQYVQHQVKQQLETAALETFTIPAAQLQWVEKGKEILLHGELFDVKKITLSGGNYIVKGLFDRKETAIAKKIAQAAGNQHKNGNTKTALQFLLLLVFSTAEQNTVLAAPAITSGKKLALSGKATCQLTISIPTPPPDMA